MGQSGQPLMVLRPWRSPVVEPKENRMDDSLSDPTVSPDEPKSEPLPEIPSLLPTENGLKKSKLYRQQSLMILTGRTNINWSRSGPVLTSRSRLSAEPEHDQDLPISTVKTQEILQGNVVRESAEGHGTIVWVLIPHAPHPVTLCQQRCLSLRRRPFSTASFVSLQNLIQMTRDQRNTMSHLFPRLSVDHRCVLLSQTEHWYSLGILAILMLYKLKIKCSDFWELFYTLTLIYFSTILCLNCAEFLGLHDVFGSLVAQTTKRWFQGSSWHVDVIEHLDCFQAEPIFN